MTLVMYRPGTPEPADTPTPGTVAAGDEGERAVIDVQQRALGALEEDPLAGLDRVEQVGGGVGHVGPQPLGIALVLLR